MPLVLLMAETVMTFRFGARQLTPWVHLVSVEEMLIDRAQSAFLVHWFGKHLPLLGSYLKIVVENLQELREQYILAGRSAEPELSGPNLTEPLAGAAGIVAGAVLAPTSMVLIFLAAVRKLSTWLQVLLGVLGTIILPPLSPLIWLGVGLYLSFKPKEKGPETKAGVGDLIEVLGSLAVLLHAARGFLDQLLGPREKVANPLLRQMLGLLDSIAGLVPQLMGFIAVVITRIGPLLLPLAVQVKAMQDLLGSVVDALKWILGDLVGNLKLLVDPKFSIWTMLGQVIDAMKAMLAPVIKAFRTFFNDALDALKGIFDALVGHSAKPRKDLAGFLVDLFQILVLGKKSTGFTGLIERSVDALDTAFTEDPFVKNMAAAKTLFTLAGDAFEDKSKPKSPSTFPTFPTISFTTAAHVKATLGGEPYLGLDDIGWLGSTVGVLNRLGIGPAPTLSDEARKELDRARHPSSVFGGEMGKLEKSLGKKPRAVLADQLADQQQIRALIENVVGRVLPPELRVYVEDVVSGFATLDTKIYGAKAEKPDFPVRDIPDNGQLRPVVHRLTVRGRGVNQLDLQDFLSRVKKAIEEQSYPAVASA